MKFGVVIRNMGPQSTRATIAACARAAEDAGLMPRLWLITSPSPQTKLRVQAVATLIR